MKLNKRCRVNLIKYGIFYFLTYTSFQKNAVKIILYSDTIDSKLNEIIVLCYDLAIMH